MYAVSTTESRQEDHPTMVSSTHPMTISDRLHVRTGKNFVQAEIDYDCPRGRQCWSCPDQDTCDYQNLSERLMLFEQACIPAVFRDAATSPLELPANATPSIKKAITWIIKWGMTEPLPSRGLLLSGPNGAGKSFALAALLTTLTLERGISCFFLDFRQLLRQLKECYDTTKQDSIIFNAIRQVDVLVLDDVGSSPATSWSQDIFETIISYRYNDLTRTFLTTNLAVDWTASPSPCPFAHWAGAHAFSRLRQMCYFLPFDGPDRRTNTAF